MKINLLSLQKIQAFKESVDVKTAYGIILALIILLASCKGSKSASPAPAPAPAWVVSTLAGSGTSGHVDGAAADAQFNRPYGVAVDSSDNVYVYVADKDNHRIRRIEITPGEGQEEDTVEVSTIAGSGTRGGYQKGVGTSARFNFPYGVAVDSSDNVYVADALNQRIRRIEITPGEGQEEDTVEVSTIAGDGEAGDQDDTATTTARFSTPTGVAVDSLDNVYVADFGNNRIRKITKKVDAAGKETWTVSTLAGSGMRGYQDGAAADAQFDNPYGVAVDSLDNVYVADLANQRIRKITETKEVDADGNKIWTVCTLAGSTSGYQDGVGTAARFRGPSGVALDSLGNVYVADSNNHRIRKITKKVDDAGDETWTVSTLAGSGTRGHVDGTAARFNFPTGVALDSSDNVYVADALNNRIRKIEYRVP